MSVCVSELCVYRKQTLAIRICSKQKCGVQTRIYVCIFLVLSASVVERENESEVDDAQEECAWYAILIKQNICSAILA